MGSFLRKIIDFREFFLILIIIVGGIVLSFASPIFLTSINILALLKSLSVEAIIAVGMTILLVSGSFDLSVGTTLAFSGSMTAMMLKGGFPVVVAVFLGILIGVGIGLINGFVSAKIGINAFITTLGTMMLFRGLLQVITNSRNITNFPQSFKLIGQAKILGIQSPILIAAVLIIIGDIALRKTKFFRQNYYIGGNDKAAQLSGINVNNMIMFNFTLCGALAALAGVVMTARLGSASVTAGQGLEFRVITAVIVGGASLKGGEGTIFGAFLGAFLVALITNALTLLGVNVYFNQFVIGITLLLAVIFDNYNQKKKEMALK